MSLVSVLVELQTWINEVRSSKKFSLTKTQKCCNDWYNHYEHFWHLTYAISEHHPAGFVNTKQPCTKQRMIKSRQMFGNKKKQPNWTTHKYAPYSDGTEVCQNTLNKTMNSVSSRSICAASLWINKVMSILSSAHWWLMANFKWQETPSILRKSYKSWSNPTNSLGIEQGFLTWVACNPLWQVWK